MATTARGTDVPNYDVPASTSTEHPPRPLADALAEATAGATFNLALVKEAAQTAFLRADLQSAGPTRHSEAMLARCEQALEDYRLLDKKPPKATLAERATWERKVRVARERDRLHADRQRAWPGCWCLGFGGTRPEPLVAISRDGRRLPDPDVERYWDPCPCPIGQEHVALVDRRTAELLATDQQRRIRRLWADLKTPEIPDHVTLASHPDQVKVQLAQRWYDKEFDPGVLFAGPNQRGKTVTAYLLARRAIEDGKSVIAITVPDLFDRLIETFRHDESLKGHPDHPAQTTHADLIASLQTVDFLLLDDLGTENRTDYVERALFQILDGRADNSRDPVTGAIVLQTLITTNLKREELAPRFGERIYSRIVKLGRRINFLGPRLGPAAAGLTDLDSDLDTWTV